MKRLLSILTALVTVTLTGTAIYLWSPLGSNQSLSAALADAQQYDVEIIRDSWGVPHIFGIRDVDVAFGLGYAQSEDDLETLQTVTAASRGVLARYQGEGAAVSDYLVTVLGVWDLIEEKYASQLPQPSRLLAEAYAKGVNLYAAEHPKKSFEGLYPMTGKDVIAGFIFKTPFFYGADKVMTSLLTGKGDRSLAIAPAEANTVNNPDLIDVYQLRINPSSGIVFNANNSPFRATNGADNLLKENFDPTFGLQDDDTNRSLRLMELTRDMQPISRDRLLEIKFDKSYSKQSIAAKVVAEVLAQDWSSDTTMDAVALLNASYGRVDPKWGEVNRIIRGEVDLPIGGAPDILRAVYPGGPLTNGKYRGAAGDTLIIMAEWSKDGLVKGSTIHQFGSATLDTTSVHYADQVSLFADEKFRPVLMDRKDIEADASIRYRPGKQ